MIFYNNYDKIYAYNSRNISTVPRRSWTAVTGKLAQVVGHRPTPSNSSRLCNGPINLSTLSSNLLKNVVEYGMALHDTRQQIIEYLKEKEQATVDELASAVNLTSMAVRYHLNVLQKDNLISAPAVRRPAGRGRPQQVYKLTEAADELFPVDYLILTDYLLDELRMQLGDRGINDLFNRIASRLADEAPAARKDQTTEERLDEVVYFLREKGFVVDWQREDNHYVIHAYSCPYRQVAKHHGQVCILDKKVIGSMLNTEPARTACITSGDGHCTYRISEPIPLMVDMSAV